MYKKIFYKVESLNKLCYCFLMANFSITLSNLFHKRGQTQSFWFRRKEFHSFAQWVTHLFQIQIADAFNKKKTFKVNPYNFVADYSLEKLEKQLKNSIVSVLSKNLPKVLDPAIKQKHQQEKKYVFGKCWDRIQAQSRHVICQYSWLNEDRTGQFAHIMDQMYIGVHQNFQLYLVQQEIIEIGKFENDLNKSTNKKKKHKKKHKKNHRNQNQQADDSDTQEVELNIVHLKKQEPKSKLYKQSQIKKKQEKKQTYNIAEQKPPKKIEKSPIVQNYIQNSQKVQTTINERSQRQDGSEQSKNQSSLQSQGTYTKKHKKERQRQVIQRQQKSFQQKQSHVTSSTIKTSLPIQSILQRHTTKTTFFQSQSQQGSQPSQKQKSKSLSKHSIIGVSMKKIDRKVQEEMKKLKAYQNVMGNGLECYAKMLKDESQKFHQTRKEAVDLIRDFIHKQDIKVNWELVLFGSSEVGYALKQSDIDLVFRIQDAKVYSLKDMENGLKLFPWALSCQYISTANVPIITLKVNLYQARKLSNRLLKKLDKAHAQGQNILSYSQEFIITLDISMCGLNQQYGGIVSSNNLRFLFYQNQPLKKIILIVKDLLRRRQLNKPYHGGINSYVLAMMMYGIIKKKELQLTKSVKIQNQYITRRKKEQLESLKTNLYVAICQISAFLKDFVCFQTLINPLDEKIQGQTNIHLNIVDPFSKKLVKTSAFRIYEIIEQLQTFKLFLDNKKDEIKPQQLQNKRLKSEVYQKIAEYMNELEPAVMNGKLMKNGDETMYLLIKNN